MLFLFPEPRFFHEFEAFWVDAHKFALYERMKIIGSKKGLRGFRKVLGGIGQCIVLAGSAVDIKHLIIVSRLNFGFPGSANTRVLVA